MEVLWTSMGSDLIDLENYMQANPKISSITKDCWERVRNNLRIDVGEAAFNSWLRQIAIISENEDKLIVAVPSRFMRDWIISHYYLRIQEMWDKESALHKTIEIHISPHLNTTNSSQNSRETSGQDTKNKSKSDPVKSGEVALTDIGASLDPRFTFDAFVVGKPNELAYAAALRVAEAPTVPFNPLYLYGGVGLGKTHLMHAIAWHIHECDPNRKVIYLSAEKFMYQFIRALRYKDVMSFKQLFRSVDVLMIDDVQFISGKESTQEEFFHTFNALVDQNRQVIISGDRSPSNLDGMEERMRSRLG